jgi:hypothetical protein
MKKFYFPSTAASNDFIIKKAVIKFEDSQEPKRIRVGRKLPPGQK